MRELRSVKIEVSDDENIVVSELSILEHQLRFITLIEQYGDIDTFSNFKNSVLTKTTFEILSRLQFSHIASWTLKDMRGEIIPLTYENYLELPYQIGNKVVEVVESFK